MKMTDKEIEKLWDELEDVPIDEDEWYVEDIAETIKIIEEVLATTDFETQMVAYVSSW